MPAKQSAVASRDELHHALGLTIGDRPVHVGERSGEDADIGAVPRSRVVLRKADVRQLGVGVRHPRNSDVVRLCLHGEERVPDDESGLVVGDVRESWSADDVAAGPHTTGRGAEMIVNDDATLVDSDANAGEIERLGAGDTAGCHEQVRTLDDARSGGRLERERDAAGRATSLDGLRTEVQLDALSHQSRGEQLRQLRLLARHEGRRRLDDGDPTAKAHERLRELEADRTAPQHQEMCGSLGDLEDGLVREVRHAVESADGRHRWTRARRHDDALRGQAAAIDVDDAVTGEPRRALHDFDPESTKPLRTVVWCDARACAVHPPHRARKVDTDGRIDAIPSAVRCMRGELRAREERLARDASGPEAFSAELVALDQRGAGTDAGRPCGGHESRCPATNDDHVESFHTMQARSMRVGGLRRATR